MKKLEGFLAEYSISEKRSALYYLTRYLKQAETFEDYKKDIFEDEIYSRPDDGVKSLTINMIDFIEKEQGKKASEFNGQEFHFWMGKIAKLEDSIDEVGSEELIQKALSELNNFKSPQSDK